MAATTPVATRPVLRALLRSLLLGPAVLLVIHAQEPAQHAASEATQRRLDRLGREIERLSTDRDRFAREASGVLGRLQRLESEARLLDAQRERYELQTRLAEEALTRCEQSYVAAADALDAARARFRAILLGLHRAGPIGRWRPVLTARGPSELAHGVRVAHELSRRQRTEVSELRRAQTVLETQRTQLATRHAEQEALALAAGDNATALQATIAERRQVLRRIEREQAVRTEAIGELRRASDQLEKLLSDGTEGAVDLDIRRFRGLLDPPPGKLLRPFGDRIDPRFGTRLPHPGWDLDLPFAAPVPAIWSGRVVYADWFRGYGLTVVLDHGQGIHSVYAHLSAIVTPSGTQVAAGESVGRVGDTGSLEGPFLYFELRQRGKAVDPAEWFKR